MIDSVELKQALLAEREASFFRLRGGFPIALAGATWWAILGVLGYTLRSRNLWIFIAFVTSGTLFPLALLFAKLFKNNFMRDRTSVTGVLFPAFTSMLLFWPMAISAWWTYPPLVPLVLAIGMSIVWPVIGWMYARPEIYTAHAVVRAIVCFVLWNWFPATRFTVLPLAVSLIYLLTVVAIFVASAPKKQSLTQKRATAA
jgi:hypothetical protein